MTEPRKEFHFDANDYERPNQTWMCGWASVGMPCPRGPDEHGVCGAVCTPYKVVDKSGNEGDRWICANESSQGGQCDEGPLSDGMCCQDPPQCKPSKTKGAWVCNRGKCEQGPLPDGSCCQQFAACQPVRSILSKRRRVTFVLFALTVGIALAMIGGPAPYKFVSPGKLTLAHNTITSCADCHQVGKGDLEDWVRHSLTAQGNNQSSLCLECHKTLPEHALHPHGCDPQKLQTITNRIAEGRDGAGREPMLLAAARSLGTERDTWVCATCHHEHRGEDFSISQMNDEQCQTCHTRAFQSFTRGHPEFVDYPYGRRTRLYFDHLSHYGRHFSDSRRFDFETDPQQRACISCHQPDGSGRGILVRGFEESCGSCHEHQIRSERLPGIALISLPDIDSRSLGSRIGSWPQLYPLHAQALTDLTPFMKLLLSTDKRYAASIKALDGVDLSDLEDATLAQLDAAADYASAIKHLFHDVAENGQASLRRRLADALQLKGADADLDQLLNLLPFELLVSAQQRWLSGAVGEVATGRDALGDDQPEETTDSSGATATQDPVQALENEKIRISGVATGWYLRDSDMTIRYRPHGHADSFLTALCNLSTRFRPGPGQQDDPDSVRTEALKQLFHSVAGTASMGRCLKCHTVDDQPHADALVNWQAKQPDPHNRVFTQFDHRPHLTRLSDDTCLHCHKIKHMRDSDDPEALFRVEFVSPNWTLNTDASTYTSDFVQLTKANCAKCHMQENASESCLTCHNYHVTDPLSPSITGR